MNILCMCSKCSPFHVVLTFTRRKIEYTFFKSYLWAFMCSYKEVVVLTLSEKPKISWSLSPYHEKLCANLRNSNTIILLWCTGKQHQTDSTNVFAFGTKTMGGVRNHFTKTAFEAVVDSLSLGLFRHRRAKLVTPLFEQTFLTHLCKITPCAQILSSLISCSA